MLSLYKIFVWLYPKRKNKLLTGMSLHMLKVVNIESYCIALRQFETLLLILHNCIKILLANRGNYVAVKVDTILKNMLQHGSTKDLKREYFLIEKNYETWMVLHAPKSLSIPKVMWEHPPGTLVLASLKSVYVLCGSLLFVFVFVIPWHYLKVPL